MEVSMEQAAVTLGISYDAVRRRVKKGTLPARQGADGRLIVLLPDGATGAPVADAGAPVNPPPAPVEDALVDAGAPVNSAGTPVGRAPVPALAMMQELDHLRALLAASERHRNDLGKTADGLHAQLAAAEERHTVQTASLNQQLAGMMERLVAAEAANSELRQLLLQAQLQVQALIPKLPAPDETPPQQRPWWQWW